MQKHTQDAQERLTLNEYWSQNIPWSFRDVPNRPSFEERRKMRYALQDYMAEAIRFQDFKGKSVLEVGCGAGIDSVEFARNGAFVTAMDTSPLAVYETKGAFKEAGAKGTVLLGDIREKEFAGKFDAAYSFGVLHHIKEADSVIEAIRANLKDGGEFIGMFYNRDSILYAYSQFHGISIERVPDAPYIHPYTREELRALLDRFFSRVSIVTYYNVIDLPSHRKAKLPISDALGLGWHHIARCIA